MDNTGIIEKVRQLADIKAKIAALNEDKKKLEAFFLKLGGDNVADTKYKSATYVDPNSQAAVTYTEAQSLSIDAPNYLRDSLGEVFPDLFEEKKSVTISPVNKNIERMLIGIYTGGYVQMLPSEVIGQLPCDESKKAALTRKLKGITFEKDRDSLMEIGGFSQEEASDYAYLYAEAVVWQTFCRIAEMTGADKAKLLHSINLGVSVSSSTKIAVN